jgi:hypothetical protein
MSCGTGEEVLSAEFEVQKTSNFELRTVVRLALSGSPLAQHSALRTSQ